MATLIGHPRRRGVTSDNASGGAAVSFATRSLLLDGSNEYVSVADAANLDFTTAMSASLWFKGGSGGEAGLFAKADYGAGQRSWYIERSSPNKIAILISGDGSGGKYWETTASFFDNAWHQVGFSFGASTFKIYVDGVEITSVTKFLDGAVASLFVTAIPVSIGALRTNGNPALFVAANLCQIALWDIALTPAQFAAVYNAGMPPDLEAHSASANLVSYWPIDALDTIAADGILDNKGVNHGTPVNMEAGDITTTVP